MQQRSVAAKFTEHTASAANCHHRSAENRDTLANRSGAHACLSRWARRWAIGRISTRCGRRRREPRTCTRTSAAWWNGRHRGLKIPWGATPVWVRVPSRPLASSCTASHTSQFATVYAAPCPRRRCLHRAHRRTQAHRPEHLYSVTISWNRLTQVPVRG